MYAACAVGEVEIKNQQERAWRVQKKFKKMRAMRTT